MKKNDLLKGRRMVTLLCLFITALGFAQSQTFTSTGNFTVPAGVTSIQVEAWGAGGAGGGATGSPAAGGGGAGGGYVKNTALAVVPGTTYTVTIGTGGVGGTGAGQTGGSSWFGSTGTLLAVGGKGGNLASANSNTAAGATALTTGNVGFSDAFSYYGGAGGTGAGSGASGGGGGGSAGSASNGNLASGVTGGAAVTDGGAGVNGSTSSADGADNTHIGGGGAGARTSSSTNRSGGNGGKGQVIITWVCPIAQPAAITGATSACRGTSQNYSVTAIDGITYDWTFPAGWTQTEGTTTNSITVTVGSGSGNITVTPSTACGSGPAQVLAVTSIASPTITGTTPGSRTDYGPIGLAATASSGTISWYASAAGGSALGTGANFTTPDLVTTTTYYVETNNGQCTSTPRVAVVATINAPEIAVSGNGFNIVDEDTTPETTDYTDLGTSNVSIGLTRTYTIQNTGSVNLTIGAFTITGTNAAEFAVTLLPASTLAPGESTTFKIKFTPTAAGVRNAMLSFVTNDADENPFNFYIRGTGGTGVTPEINLVGLGNTIIDGDSGPVDTDGTDFGTLTIPATQTRTFTIQNLGTGPLILSGGPAYVNLTGSPDFTVISQPNGTIAAGSSTTFQVKYTPSTTGTSIALITVNNNDGDESIYDFAIQGTAVNSGRDIGIQGNEVLIADGATTANITDQTDFGITDLSTPISIPFNVYSFGTSTLNISSTAITSGNGFTITSLSGNISSGSPNSFVVTFTPSVIGIKTATVTVTSNANSPSSKATYTFVVKAEVQNLAPLSSAPGGITSNLKFWLKANSETATLNDNDAVNIWEDQTYGSTKNALAKFAKEPKFKNNAADNVNFNPVIHFNGSNSMSGSQGFNHQDLFMVLRPTNTITYASNAQDIYCGDDIATNKNSQDVTGFQMGNTSTRHTNDILAYNQGANTSYGVAEISTTKSYSGVNIFNPRKSAANRMMILCNGNALATTEVLTGTYKNIVNSRYWLGRSEFFDASYEGDILEIINYSAKNSDADKSKIETYLAIKYGITLGVNGTSQDYVDSDGNVIYTAASGFNYNIAGIGRDDKSALNQKQSKTENTTSDITIGLGNIYDRNSDNTNTFDSDKGFLVWGSNNGTLGAQQPVLVNMSSGIPGLTTNVDFTSVGRTWRVMESGGDVKTVTVSIPSTMLTSTITPPGDFLMFISNSPIFSPTAEYRIMHFNGSKLETTYDFDGTKYITFGYAPERTFERSITFDGTDDYLDAGNVLDLHNSFTVSAWIKRNGASQTILSKRNSTFTAGYDLNINSSGNLEMSWINGTRQTITSSIAIPAGKWHNVAVSFDGTNARLYIDGVLDVAQMLSPVPDNTQSFLIAAADGANTTSFFNGTIDEVRVWGLALTADQMRYVMNQELLKHPDNTTNGSIIPQGISLNEVKTIPWSDLRAYYSMSTYTYTNAKDKSQNDYTAALKNLTTVDYQTAPLPYVSNADGPWYTPETWKNNTVQDLPYALSIIDGTTRIAWNIVQVNHNIESTGNKIVLGMDVAANKKLTAGNDTKIEVSHYLKLNGKIDLEGESQLIQTLGSDLDAASSGSIERDQQGTKNIYNYNYWSSPVGGINSTENNSSYTLSDVLKDGTDPANIKNINWIAGYDGAPTDPISLASYWIYKFQNVGNDYANWTQVGASGALLPGEGFTLKGSGTANESQNYTFVGKPNNGTITLPIGPGFINLTGNPYASALDANQFIDDNIGAIDGTLYFWEHYPTNNTHVLADYQGGYAAYTKTGGTPPVSPSNVSGLGSSERLAHRYIPVGQGFFITGNASGGTFSFNNGQRLFVKETSGSSNIMFRPANAYTIESTNNNEEDSQSQSDFMKIRLGFNSANNYHRQILMGFMNDLATSAIDPGYDALLFDDFPNDMYFLNGDSKLVIQGEGYFEPGNQYPLGIKTSMDGNVQFILDELDGFDQSQDIFIYDAETGIYHNIREGIFELDLPAGLYESRFSLRFANGVLGTDNFQEDNGLSVIFTNSDNMLTIENKSMKANVDSVTVFNILGQDIQTWNVENDPQEMIRIPVGNISSGTYIVKLQTTNGVVSRKIAIR